MMIQTLRNKIFENRDGEIDFLSNLLKFWNKKNEN